MKSLVAVLFKVYAALAAYLVALVALVTAVLFWSGSLTPERVEAALQVLRTPKPEKPERPVAVTDDERRALERTQRQREETLEGREKALGALDALAAAELGQIRKDREDLDGVRKVAAAELEALKKEREAFAQAKLDAEMAANVPILSKLDGTVIVQVMKGWDNPTFVRYLRALKPAKAAEVLEVLETDPQLEPEFRRVAPGAPPGTRPRLDLLVEELKKAP
jgi:hypothetical protein